MFKPQLLTTPIVVRNIKRPVLKQSFHSRAKYLMPTATALASETGENVKSGALGRTASGERLKIRTYPKISNLEDERLYRKQHLAAAFRVFAERGYDEGVAGHISKFRTTNLEQLETDCQLWMLGVRDPILTDHFCMFDPVVGHEVGKEELLMQGQTKSRAEPTLSTLLPNNCLIPNSRRRRRHSCTGKLPHQRSCFRNPLGHS